MCYSDGMNTNPNTATPAERRALYAALVRETLANMTPNMPGRFSGQQIAYAKGAAGRKMTALGF